MKINFKGKDIEISDVKKCNWFEEIKGLMFCRREKARALLFGFDTPSKMAIHSFFVFFPFLAIWMDKENKILEIKRIKPFRLRESSTGLYSNLLEIPINKEYKEILNSFVTDEVPKRFK